MNLADKIIGRAQRRSPDVMIGGPERPYMLRWWMIRRNWLFGLYLHCFKRSDDDRALHDHPWWNCSIILRGSYIEHTIDAGGIHRRRRFDVGDWKIRWSGRYAHRIELIDGDCWTLFFRGPVYRMWGFHCPDAGWISWERFVSTDDKGSVGAGCQG